MVGARGGRQDKRRHSRHAHNSRRRLLGLLPAALVAVLAGRHATAASPGVSDREIIVGRNITLQGGRNVCGAEVQSGIQACLDDINRNRGVHGRQLVLRTLDDDNDATKAEAHARQLVAEGAFVLLSSIEGGPSTAVMKAAVELGVPFIGPRVALFHADSSVGREHLAKGMVFSQIVPNPRAGKSALAREYQSRLARSHPGQPLSYGGLEGYMTAKALTLALHAAGHTPTCTSLLAAQEEFEADLGGLPLRWRKGEHVGSAFVDLAPVGRDGRFVQQQNDEPASSLVSSLVSSLARHG